MNRLWARSVGVGMAGMLVVAACSAQETDSSAPALGTGAASQQGAPDGSGGLSPAPELSSELSVSTAGWSTDFSRHEVPLNEFLSGGPGKDGIPAIDEPTFEPIGDVDWLDDTEPVIAFGSGDEWRAYPIQILIWHEIVNDTVAGTPVVVTFCPLCHTAVVFDRTVGGTTLDFGVSGNLRHSDLVMYDRQTESWWQQATGRAIVGTHTGTALEFLASQLISWAQFRELHPDGVVLSRDTGHDRDYGSNPYVGYDRVDTDPFLLQDTTLIDGRLNPKVRIVGVVIGDEEVAYPLPDLAEVGVVNDSVGGEPIVVLWLPGTVSGLGGPTVAGGEEVGTAVVFSRTTENGTVLEFEAASAAGMRDTATGSTWSLDGIATDGPMAGERLAPVPNDQPFWFAWAIFRPDTTIWEPSRSGTGAAPSPTPVPSSNRATPRPAPGPGAGTAFAEAICPSFGALAVLDPRLAALRAAGADGVDATALGPEIASVAEELREILEDLSDVRDWTPGNILRDEVILAIRELRLTLLDIGAELAEPGALDRLAALPFIARASIDRGFKLATDAGFICSFGER